MSPIVGAVAAALLLIGCGSSAGRQTPPIVRLADPAKATASPVTVSPLPGTPDASATTQISFLGGHGTKVSDVRVVGSLSGRHAGRLEAYSTGTGESFVPSRRFVAGELVRVTASVSQEGISATVRTDFHIALQAPVGESEFPNHAGSAADVQHYLSAPSLTPSTVTVTTPARSGATPGDFFLAPYQGAGTAGPMIVDQSGGLVWFRPLPPGVSSTNFRPQRYEGHTVLTWWQGRILQLGFGQGTDEIYNTSYQPVATVRAGNGYKADLHEFLLTPQGTAWIDIFDPVDVNLSRMGGSADGVVTDSIVEEIDVKTGLVMWEWHALGHIPLRDTYTPMPPGRAPWDYAHVNSIDPGSRGQLLLSSRNSCTIFDVNMHTGEFVWRIGGKYPSFHRAPGTFFYYQHDAAWQPGGLVSVFDNGGSPDRQSQSRGLLLDPNTHTKTVTLVKQFTNPAQPLLATSQGDLLNLGDGNWLIGYGGLPNFTEYDSAGQVLFDATLGPNVQDFRTYLAPWHASPRTRPSIAAQLTSPGHVNVEASWNGATAVAAWRILAGPSAGALTRVTTTAKHGFQTTIHVRTDAPYMAVAAIGASGQTLATSIALTPAG